jgi:small nuclear ribonucleoprotein (snRNP)-like protein
MAKANVRTELEKATGVTKSKDESLQEFYKRIIRKVAKLEDKEWDALSDEAKNWYNDAADQANEKKEITDPPGDEPEQEPESTPRRRAVRDADDDGGASKAEPKVGDTVTVTLNDGEKVKGTLTELDEKNIVLDVKGEEEVFRKSKVKNIEVVGGGKPAAKDDDDAPKAKDPKVGDTVELTTTDGEIHKGELIELDEKNVVLEIKGEEEPFRRSKVKSMVATSASKGKAKDDDDDKPARRGSSKGKDDDEKPRTRATRGEGGESDVTKAWKLMANNLDWTFDQAVKGVAKADLEVKENTLKIKYDDVHKHVALFKELGLIKK